MSKEDQVEFLVRYHDSIVEACPIDVVEDSGSMEPEISSYTQAVAYVRYGLNAMIANPDTDENVKHELSTTIVMIKDTNIKQYLVTFMPKLSVTVTDKDGKVRRKQLFVWRGDSSDEDANAAVAGDDY